MTEERIVSEYIEAIQAQLSSGHAREHAYRPALERLMSSFEDVRAINDPKRSENGNPDFVFLRASNRDIILGYAEAKDITISVDKTLNTDQLRRYAGYEKLFLTNYLDFVFLQNGEEYERISLGKVSVDGITIDHSQFDRLYNELHAFLDKAPEQIRSGKRLSIIMGGKARRIRDNVQEYLKHEGTDKNTDLENIFKLMKELLVHDLTKDKFADMYAQTLVYGLFAARYNDSTPEDFSRREAVELVPKSNPFLRKFFDHIAGADFDTRLRHIVDELCEAFQVSDVQTLVHKHLRLFEVEDEKDPIIHFYEDFLKEYDPEERKRMGAYYTPVPVVRFIIRQTDEILRREFGLYRGLADTSTVIKNIDHGQELQIRNQITGKIQKTSIEKRKFHKVQVLDPAVGTATFLNETIKYIHSGFKGQEGQWPAYVNEHLIPRLHGFELMVAPYTVAHLKLGITLQETGVKNIDHRLGVYLTNSLEEGIPRQQDLFASLGLAQAVTDESYGASEVKHERPVMVVMGNPPYSVSSNNKSTFIQNLIKDYKKDLNERKINLDDDYIKFIRFAEDMIKKNDGGILAYITNNSYISGITHRQMRKHLLETFDKIFILDLHGNSKKNEKTPSGEKDENVFDIMQGVAISIMVKTSTNNAKDANVYHTDLYGKRSMKFNELKGNIKYSELDVRAPNYFFVPKDLSLEAEYLKFVSIDDLFINYNSGIQTKNDNFSVSVSEQDLMNRLDKIQSQPYEILEEQFSKNGVWSFEKAYDEIINGDVEVIKYFYKPFDYRYLIYGPENKVLGRSRAKTSSHMIKKDNIALTLMRGSVNTPVYNTVLVTDSPVDINLYGFQSYFMPLYIFHNNGEQSINFDNTQIKLLTKNISPNFKPEEVFDYIYAVLYSSEYRKKYAEFLKTDFPRIPPPKNTEVFKLMSSLGKDLRELHLMKITPHPDTVYPIPGTNRVENIRYDNGKVLINSMQYFDKVPEKVWNFVTGGYYPAQKWLKDRKGCELSSSDIDEYQLIIKKLKETTEIMGKIDVAWSE